MRKETHFVFSLLGCLVLLAMVTAVLPSPAATNRSSLKVQAPDQTQSVSDKIASEEKSPFFLTIGPAVNLQRTLTLRLKLIMLGVLAGALFGTIVSADDWNNKTQVNFDQNVQVSGQVLPQGTYVFKLFSSGANRNIVQVWDGTDRQLIATLPTVGD